jgi:methyltransferase-like protein
MMIEHVKNIPEPTKKIAQARALLHFLVESNAKSNTAHAIYLRTEADLLAKMPDSYILHEHLEDTNQAFYFRDFIAFCSKFGLQFLGEASISSTWAGNLSPEAQKGLEPITDAVARGHYMDCIVGRTFRESYLVPHSAQVNRSLEDSRLRDIRFTAQLEISKDVKDPKTPTTTRSYKLKTGHNITTSDYPTQVTFDALSEVYPQSLSLDQVFQVLESKNAIVGDRAKMESALRGVLVHGVLGGWIDFRFLPDRLQVKNWKRPRVTAWAKAQAQANHFVTNLKHEFVRIDSVQRQIVPLLDGTRDVNDIAAELKVFLETGLLDVKVTGTLNPNQLPKLVAEQSLKQLAEKSMFLPE